ncbi:Calcineurin-like phosphoesterase superfamily domain protein [Candidatus Nitrosocosmicus oleophilus]|uniref:Calcineurin-like phosphoesterase superfamily domain protein n=2 Tax=Candidatus Nitrosocosmicus oleophilus TaxID=1353260 RepID=A0A654LZW8_9ARCH|nr:Calcineurin-like phosphoesterase superfamily domain protein [Candidatus Nitrosocosmicus oleophilus]
MDINQLRPMIEDINFNKSRCFPLYPHPILMIETSGYKNFLVISDIHIGLEDKIRRNGILIDPRQNIDESIKLLTNIHWETGVNELIILGDLKSSIRIITRTEWDNVPYFLESLNKLFNVYLIPGNHDGNIKQLLPENVNLMRSKGIEFDNILLTHGHTLPRIGMNVEKIIVGHLHPIIQKEGSILQGNKIWVKINLTKKDLLEKNQKQNTRKLEIIIMPHFNNILDYYGKRNRNTSGTSGKSKLPLLDNMINRLNWSVEKAFLFTMDGSIIGSEVDLAELLY